MFARQDSNTNPLIAAATKTNVPFSVVAERGRFDYTVISQLRSIVDRNSPDVIWSNSVKSHFLIRAAGLHRSRKWVAFHHGYTTPDAKMRIYNQLDRWSLPSAHRVLTVCRPFAADLARRGVEPSRIRIQHVPIRPGSPPARVDCARLRQQLRIPQRTRIILSVGRLSGEKGHRTLIQAFASLQGTFASDPFALVLVGDGPERARLQEMAKACGVANSVVFAGYQSRCQSFLRHRRCFRPSLL